MFKRKIKYVSAKHFVEQVKKIEGINIAIVSNKTGERIENEKVLAYPFHKSAPDNMNLVEFWKKRIKPCLLGKYHYRLLYNYSEVF